MFDASQQKSSMLNAINSEDSAIKFSNAVEFFLTILKLPLTATTWVEVYMLCCCYCVLLVAKNDCLVSCDLKTHNSWMSKPEGHFG